MASAYLEKLAGCKAGDHVMVRGSRIHQVMPYTATVSKVDEHGVHCLRPSGVVIVDFDDVTASQEVMDQWTREASGQ